MKIRKILQASVDLTIDERKTLENAVDLLIDMGNDLDSLKIEFEGIIPENVTTMEEDIIIARYRLQKILLNIENMYLTNK